MLFFAINTGAQRHLSLLSSMLLPFNTTICGQRWSTKETLNAYDFLRR
ncbi:hypothetical protein [Flavobacterium sp.]